MLGRFAGKHADKNAKTVQEDVPFEDQTVTLDAQELIGEEDLEHLGESMLQDLPLDVIDDSPFQPRLEPLTQRDVSELMAAISAAGQVTPIVVSPAEGNGGRFHVHSGHRRCAALRFLGRKMVRAVVRTGISERDARRIVLADNLGREDLSAYEQAHALMAYVDEYEQTIEAAAAELGIAKRTAARLKSLLKAPKELQDSFRKNKTPAKPAALLAKVGASNARKALRLAERYRGGLITSVDIEAALKRSKAQPRAVVAGRAIEITVDDQVLALKIRLVRETINDDDVSQVQDAIAKLIGAMGIHHVDASA